MRARLRSFVVVLTGAAVTAAVAVTAPAGSASAVDAVSRPTDVAVTFVQWHGGSDEFQLSWTAPAEPVSHYAIFSGGGSSPAAPPDSPLTTVAGDQTTAVVDVPIVTNEVSYHDQVSFAVYAYNEAGDAWAASDPVTVSTDLGADLTVAPESGVAHQVEVSWAAPAAGDRVILGEAGVSDPIALPDDTQAGSLAVDIGSAAYSPEFSLSEQVIADPEQTSPARVGDSPPAPKPAGDFSVGVESPTSLHVGLTALPVGCPGTSYWITHCVNMRFVAKEGTSAPTSPSDGISVTPALGDSAADRIGGS